MIQRRSKLPGRGWTASEEVLAAWADISHFEIWNVKQEWSGITWPYFYSFLMTSDVGHCFICLLDSWFCFFQSFSLSRGFWKMLQIWSILPLRCYSLVCSVKRLCDTRCPGSPLPGVPNSFLSCSGPPDACFCRGKPCVYPCSSMLVFVLVTHIKFTWLLAP